MNRLAKAAIAIVFALCGSAAAHAQCVITTVSGTITDPNGLPYSYATITAALQPAAQSPTCGGSPIGGINHAQADVNGTFSMPVAANTSISPGGTTWVFTIQANSGLPAPVGKGTQTFSTTGLTITGSTQSLTSTLSALATALTVPLSGGGTGNFGTLMGGTNTSATMIVGTGASLGFTGAGTVNANILDNVVLSGTPAAGDCPVATTAIAGSWVLCPTASGSLTQGFPLIGTGTQMQAVPYPLNASLFAGNDPGLQLQAALNACPTTANTLCLVDASSIPTTNAATVNPYANVNAIGGTSAVILIQLPCQPITTNVVWLVNKNDVITRGCGLHNSNAELVSGAGLASNSPVVQIGDGATNHLIFNSRFENLRIVASGASTGAYGFLGQLLNERAGLWRVNIIGQNSATPTNPLVKCTGCAHETLSDLELANAGDNDAFLLDGINVVQQAEGDVSNITVNNTGGGTGVQGTNGIHVQSTGATGNSFYTVSLKNIHAENFVTAVNFDSQSAGMWSMVDCSSACTNGVIRNTNGYVDGDSFGSQLGSFNQYVDQITGASLPDTTFFRVNHLSGGPGAEILGGTIQPTAAKTTAYTLSMFDGQITGSTTNQITIPHALPGTLFAKVPWVVINNGSGSLPLGCDSGNTNGSASPASLPANQMALIGTDGTNCFALFGSSGSGTNPLTAIGQVYVGGASGTPIAAPAGITGQALTATNAATPAFASPGLSDSANSPVTSTSYTIACDSSTTIIDRVHTLRFQSGASTPVVPLSSASGCGVGFVTTVIDDGAGNLVFGRTSADTFSVFNGSTASDSQTSFTLTNGQYATLNVAASGVWEVRITASSASGVTSYSGDSGGFISNSSSTGAVTTALATQPAKSVMVGPRFGSAASPAMVASPSPVYTHDITSWAYFFDDFNCQYSTTTFGCSLWANSGTGCTVGRDNTPTGTGSVFGVALLSVAATTSDNCTINSFGASTSDMATYNTSTGDIYIRFTCPTTLVSCFAGLSQISNSSEGGEVAAAAIGVAFDTNQSDTHWMCVTKSGGVATRTSLSNTPDANFHTAHIRFAAGTIGCSIDGGSEVTQSTNVPSGALSPNMTIINRTTAAKIMEWDYYWYGIGEAR